MTMGIQRRFSISGRRYSIKILSVEVDEAFQQLLNIGILHLVRSDIRAELEDETRYKARVVINRKLVSTDVWAHDELGAVRELMNGLKDRVARHYYLDRYDRPKRLQRRK